MIGAIGLKLDQAKSFFDRAAVIGAMDKKSLAACSKFGAFVRTKAISLILRTKIKKGFGVTSKTKDREGVSKPGEPPYSHTGDVAKRIEFSFDTTTRSVVIGPLLFKKGTVRELEEGGKITIAGSKPGQTLFPRPARTVTLAARPFMQPSFDKEIPKFPTLFAG